MEQLKQQVKDLTADVKNVLDAVFGDRSNPKERPGILVELKHLEAAQQTTNEILLGVRSGVQKIMWLFIGSVVSALGAAIVAGLLKLK